MSNINSYIKQNGSLTFQVLTKPKIEDIHFLKKESTILLTRCEGDNCKYCEVFDITNDVSFSKKTRYKVKIRCFIEDNEVYSWFEGSKNFFWFLNGEESFIGKDQEQKIFEFHHPVHCSYTHINEFPTFVYALSNRCDSRFCYPIKEEKLDFEIPSYNTHSLAHTVTQGK